MRTLDLGETRVTAALDQVAIAGFVRGEANANQRQPRGYFQREWDTDVQRCLRKFLGEALVARVSPVGSSQVHRLRFPRTKERRGGPPRAKTNGSVSSTF